MLIIKMMIIKMLIMMMDNFDNWIILLLITFMNAIFVISNLEKTEMVVSLDHYKLIAFMM